MNKKMKHQMRLAEQKRLRDAEQQTENEYIRNATMLMFYVSLLYLRDEKGYGKKRLGDFMEGCVTILNDISYEYIDFIDIKNTIYEETGVEIDFTGADNE